MYTAWKALVRKDVRLFFANRRAVLMSVVAPIAMASFFGYLFGGNGGQPEATRIPVLVVDQDGSPISRGIVARMSGDKALVLMPAGMEQAREAVRKGKATVAFVIPEKFGEIAARAFFGNAAKPEIALLYDPTHGAEMGMVQGILSGHVMEAVSQEAFGGPGSSRLVKDSLADLDKNSGLPPDLKPSLTAMLKAIGQWNAQSQGRPGASQAGLTVPFGTRTEAITSGTGIPYNGYAHYFGGMGVQFILFVGIEVGMGLLLQRREGLWSRLRAAPLSRSVLLGSRAASAAITSMFILVFMFAFARVVFGVRIQGSLPGFLGICAAFSLMTAAFGLLIAALGKTPEATRGIAILGTLLMVMLGGAWVPTFLFPQMLQKLTLAVPTRWAVDGLDAMTWRGMGFSASLGPMAVLVGFALAFGALAVARFRWEE
ncbi:MAG: ABC transporter permease [Acidobacteriia bacterium]|nr:ABC transporter permease [Terriglobia bacterium]